jgi:hypothetical protein
MPATPVMNMGQARPWGSGASARLPEGSLGAGASQKTQLQEFATGAARPGGDGDLPLPATCLSRVLAMRIVQRPPSSEPPGRLSTRSNATSVRSGVSDALAIWAVMVGPKPQYADRPARRRCGSSGSSPLTQRRGYQRQALCPFPIGITGMKLAAECSAAENPSCRALDQPGFWRASAASAARISLQSVQVARAARSSSQLILG